MTGLLDLVNRAEELKEAGKGEDALGLYDEVLTGLNEGGDANAAAVFDLTMRRAGLLRGLNRRQDCMAGYSDASRIAVEVLKDERAAIFAARLTMEALREWQDWAVAEQVGKGLAAIGHEHDMTLLIMEAGWHMPHVYRGLGRLEEAREYAQTLLERMAEIESKEGVQEWSTFLATLGDE